MVNNNLSYPKNLTLKPVRSNAGIISSYRKTLIENINEMNKDYYSKITKNLNFKKNYISDFNKNNESSENSKYILGLLFLIWSDKFSKLAENLSNKIIENTLKHTDNSIKNKFKKNNLTYKSFMNENEINILKSLIEENVSLIKSIHNDYHGDITGIIMRSISKNKGETFVKKQIIKNLGVTKRRAEIIARDQVTKANSSFVLMRQKQLGITNAIWRYTWRSKVPRLDHVKSDGKIYNTENGLNINGENIYPGELINCKCVSEWVLN